MLAEGVVEAGLAEDKQSLVFRMRGELPLRTPQPGGETLRAAPAPAAEATVAPGKEAAPKAKRRAARGKKKGE